MPLARLPPRAPPRRVARRSVTKQVTESPGGDRREPRTSFMHCHEGRLQGITPLDPSSLRSPFPGALLPSPPIPRGAIWSRGTAGLGDESPGRKMRTGSIGLGVPCHCSRPVILSVSTTSSLLDESPVFDRTAFDRAQETLRRAQDTRPSRLALPKGVIWAEPAPVSCAATRDRFRQRRPAACPGSLYTENRDPSAPETRSPSRRTRDTQC